MKRGRGHQQLYEGTVGESTGLLNTSTLYCSFLFSSTLPPPWCWVRGEEFLNKICFHTLEEENTLNTVGDD